MAGARPPTPVGASYSMCETTDTLFLLNPRLEASLEKKEGMDQSEIEREMEKLRIEIESLEDVKTDHQGYKFYRAAMSKDIFEDALIELREK